MAAATETAAATEMAAAAAAPTAGRQMTATVKLATAVLSRRISCRRPQLLTVDPSRGLDRRGIRTGKNKREDLTYRREKKKSEKILLFFFLRSLLVP
jgi:hypothetical protein